MPLGSLVLVMAGAVLAAPAQPPGSINAIIGDVSFVRATGRAPTDADDPVQRVRLHLAHVERLLRARDSAGLSSGQRERRGRLLDHLHRYWQDGAFPRNLTGAGTVPTFIDGRGARCAVAFLVEQTEGSAVIAAIDRRYHHAYLAEIDSPALGSWIAASGLTRDELALIQPRYPVEDEPPSPLDRVVVKLAADYRHAVGETTPPADLTQLGTLRGELHWFAPNFGDFGTPVLGLDGALGWGGPARTSYAARLTAGTVYAFNPFDVPYPHHAGLFASFGIDAVGDRIPRAWTVPLEAFYDFPPWHHTALGVRGGPVFRVAGAARPLGWGGAIDLTRRNTFPDAASGAVLDLGLALLVERLQRINFVGLGLAVTRRNDRKGVSLYW